MRKPSQQTCIVTIAEIAVSGCNVIGFWYIQDYPNYAHQKLQEVDRLRPNAVVGDLVMPSLASLQVISAEAVFACISTDNVVR
jgi:hypothetical protein